MKKFGIREVVATGICAALVFVLLRFVAIPTPLPDTSLGIHQAVLAFFAVLFGPIVGLLGGFLGNLLVDLTAGWGIWWSWIIAMGVFGLVTGLGVQGIDLKSGEFGKKDIIRFNVVQIIAAAISWGVVAPVLDIVMYGEPAGKVFTQGIFTAISAIVATAIVGTLICKVYASSRPKKGSLNKEG